MPRLLQQQPGGPEVLPNLADLTPEEMQYVIDAISEFYSSVKQGQLCDRLS